MPNVAQQRDGLAPRRPRVALVEALEDRVVHGLEGRHDEEAARGRELRPEVGVPQHVLDLDRAVERDAGEPRVHRPHDPQRVV